MIAYDKLVAEVDRILWEDWDPIGVNEIPEARDEYSSYVPAVVRLVQSGADESQISRHLQTIEEVSITVGVYADRRKRVAEKDCSSTKYGVISKSGCTEPLDDASVDNQTPLARDR